MKLLFSISLFLHETLCQLHSFAIFRNSLAYQTQGTRPVELEGKRQGNWAELTFAQTSGTAISDGEKNWPLNS